MDANKAIQIHDHGAESYDASVEQYGSHVHDLLFGLCYEYVQSGERLLDVGIGTGLSSEPFARMGLSIAGVDGSEEMLRLCREKGFTSDLTCHDVLNLPLPYPAGAFRHAIACGLFHFMDDLAPLFAEAARLVQPDGMFAFTVAEELPHGADAATGSGTLIRVDTLSGVRIYAHAAAHIRALCQQSGFELLKIQYFYAHAFDGPETPLLMVGYIARKTGN